MRRPLFQHHQRDVVRLRGAFGELGYGRLNGVVKRLARVGGARRHNLAQALLAEEFAGGILRLGYAVGVDDNLVAGRQPLLGHREFGRLHQPYRHAGGVQRREFAARPHHDRRAVRRVHVAQPSIELQQGIEHRGVLFAAGAVHEEPVQALDAAAQGARGGRWL